LRAVAELVGSPEEGVGVAEASNARRRAGLFFHEI
jgi:hypothetical protein